MFNQNNFHIYLIEDQKYQAGYVKVGAALNIVEHAVLIRESTPSDTLKFTSLFSISDSNGGDAADLVRGIVSEIRDNYAGTDDTELVEGQIGSWVKAGHDEVESRLRTLFADRDAIVEEVSIQELTDFRDLVSAA